MKYPTWDEQQSVYARADAIVDSEWHYAWHWKRDGYGNLTPEGWREVMRDARRLLAEHEAKVGRLRALIVDLQPIIDMHEERAREDAEDAEGAGSGEGGEA